MRMHTIVFFRAPVNVLSRQADRIPSRKEPVLQAQANSAAETGAVGRIAFAQGLALSPEKCRVCLPRGGVEITAARPKPEVRSLL